MPDPKYPPVDADIKWLTPRELKDVIDESGLSYVELADPMLADDPVAALAALAWVVTRRTFPDVTMEEAWDVPIDLNAPGPDPTNASN